ncbi:MAG TPA: hypothetical protein VGR78_07725 [Verrucomicrobiae bacterium]|jgi:galactose mutarotase-like enzyme|nr:hypothetical protein [Verrucomicrobiae bacterium]
MQAQGQLITLREGAEAKVLIAPELGGWLLRYARHFPKLGYVDALHFSQEVVDRYPNQMYAGNPLLFPMVSFNHLADQENHYPWEGHIYPLPQHGFARRSKWKVMEVQESRVSMVLTDTAATRAPYPFSFRCMVNYQLSNSRLEFQQTIENCGKEVMPFSTGIHPYFPVPITSDGERANCFVELPAAQQVIPGANWESWSTKEFSRRHLPVSEDVSGTLFLTDLAKPEVSLVDPVSGLRITLSFEGAPKHRFLAIWSKSPEDPFYCLEPWSALPNSFSRATELLRLEPGEKFEASIWLEISKI